jgi:cellulose synthase/poly-beta-1,6-N-acetylglucosamine synthase-like glycosyltransferase
MSKEQDRNDFLHAATLSQAQPEASQINREVTVIIPTLNEAEAIGLVLDELLSQGITNIVVIDGGSTDGTREKAQSKGAKARATHSPEKAKQTPCATA